MCNAAQCLLLDCCVCRSLNLRLQIMTIVVYSTWTSITCDRNGHYVDWVDVCGCVGGCDLKNSEHCMQNATVLATSRNNSSKKLHSIPSTRTNMYQPQLILHFTGDINRSLLPLLFSGHFPLPPRPQRGLPLPCRCRTSTRYPQVHQESLPVGEGLTQDLHKKEHDSTHTRHS